MVLAVASEPLASVDLALMLEEEEEEAFCEVEEEVVEPSAWAEPARGIARSHFAQTL